MGKYYFETDGISRDELQGRPGELVDVWNVNVGASAVIERGMLLCGETPTGEFKQVESESDADKIFVIARDDFEADAEHTVTQAYSRGFFNRERIKLGGASTLTLEPFEPELRRQNIFLTTLLEKF